MAPPKLIRPGDFFSSNRKTRDGMYFLTPRTPTKQIVNFHLARACDRNGLVLSSYLAMSNHHHPTGTDLLANRGAFHRDLHSGIGTELKALLRLDHGVWEPGERTYDPIILNSPYLPRHEPPPEGDAWDRHVAEALQSLWDELRVGAQARTVLYTLLNPIKANLCSKLSLYPNVWYGPHHWGRFVTVEAPGGQKKHYGDSATMLFLPPPEEWDEAGWSRMQNGILLPRKSEVAAVARRIARARKEYDDGGNARREHWEGIISAGHLKEVRQRYKAMLELGEAYLSRVRHAQGKKVFLPGKLQQQDVHDSPDRKVTSVLEIPGVTTEPGVSAARRQELADTIVVTRRRRRRKKKQPRQEFVGNPDHVKTALKGLRAWRKNYRKARERWTTHRDYKTIFPYGTYDLRLHANVRCRGRPLKAETGLP